MTILSALRSTSRRWGPLARFFHWIVALLIGAQAVLGLYMVGLPLTVTKLNIFLLHKSIGVSILVIVLLRIVWRVIDPHPSKPSDMGVMQWRAARLMHSALYVLMLLMPISGWVYNSASGFPLPWFGLWQLPSIAPVSQALADSALLIHRATFITLFCALTIHVWAALDHHWRLDDEVLRRMLPFPNRGEK